MLYKNKGCFFWLVLAFLINIILCADDSEEKRETDLPRSGFQGFITSFTSILVAETGDKTFILAGILAMKYNRWLIFSASGGALVVMTLISVICGFVLPLLISKRIMSLIAAILFISFAVLMLREATTADEHKEKETLSLKNEIDSMHHKLVLKSGKSNKSKDNEKNENGIEMPLLNLHEKQEPGEKEISRPKNGQKNGETSIIDPRLLFWQAFSMTFLAEWGDRSQFTTIALAAAYNWFIVFIGCSLGHLACTAMAVLAGKWISDRISQKTIGLVGGVIYLIFGAYTLLFDVLFVHDENNNAEIKAIRGK